MRGVPLHSVGIVVQVLNYALFNWVYKYFVVNDGRKHFLLCLTSKTLKYRNSFSHSTGMHHTG